MNNNKEGAKTPWKKIILILLLLLLGAGVIIWYLLQEEEEPKRELSAGILPGNEELDFSGAGEDSIWMQINSRPVFPDSNGEGDLFIGNPETNAYDLEVLITLTETGEQIYESGTIPPGYYIDYDRLDTELEEGEHEALAAFTYYAENGAVQSRTNAKLVITVNSDN